MRELTSEELARAARALWGVANRFHRIRDVSMGKNASTVRKDNAPKNLSLLKKIVLSPVRLDTTGKANNACPRLKPKRAA